MKELQISDPQTMIMALQDEIRRNHQSRYDHRLHGVLLVAQGMSSPQAARLLGDSPRAVENWVKGFEENGFGALADKGGRGRRARLDQASLDLIGEVLRKSPAESGWEGNLWDGRTLSAFIQKKFKITLQVRQCQRLFRQLDFRFRKPRPQVAQAEPKQHAAHKKTPQTGRRPRS